MTHEAHADAPTLHNMGDIVTAPAQQLLDSGHIVIAVSGVSAAGPLPRAKIRDLWQVIGYVSENAGTILRRL